MTDNTIYANIVQRGMLWWRRYFICFACECRPEPNPWELMGPFKSRREAEEFLRAL